MIASEKRAEANRRNAQKSTGPKTEAGKQRSKRNALKHGLRSEVVFPQDEDQNALAAEVEAWESHYSPEDPVEKALVRRGALAAIRLERCQRAESAKLDERRRHAVGRWHLERKREVETLADRLPIDPCRVVPALKETPEGCSWLLARWRMLRIALIGRGYWTIDEFAQALHLLGRSEERHRREPATCRFTAAHLAATSGRSAEEAERQGLPSADQGRAWLDRKSFREMQRLRAGRSAMRLDRTRDLALAADRILFDDSPGAALMRRYESASMADLGRCVTVLARLRAGDAPRSPRSLPRLAAEPFTNEADPTTDFATVANAPERPETRENRVVAEILPPGAEAPIGPIPAPNEPNRSRRRRSLLAGSMILAAFLAIPGPPSLDGAVDDCAVEGGHLLGVDSDDGTLLGNRTGSEYRTRGTHFGNWPEFGGYEVRYSEPVPSAEDVDRPSYGCHEVRYSEPVPSVAVSIARVRGIEPRGTHASRSMTMTVLPPKNIKTYQRRRPTLGAKSRAISFLSRAMR